MTDSANASPHGSPLQVLLVCPRGEHVDAVRRLAQQGPRETRVHWTADPEQAVRMAMALAPELAIVDARIDRATACELVSRLVGCHADMSVMTFDDRGAPALREMPSTWHWSELQRAVNWWLGRGAPASRTLQFA